MPGLYTPVTIKKVRQNLDVKRDFLTGLFFEKSSKSLTPTIILEYTKAGEAVAPFLTPMEAGRPVYSRTKKSNVINAPSIGPEYSLTEKDLFERPAGASIEEFNPAIETGKRIGEILGDQENYIKNRIELMVSQFLTTAFKKAVSQDLQSEFVKKAVRTYPGIIWIGTYKKFGVELFSYSRKVTDTDGKSIQLMPTNMVIGGPAAGEVIYAPIVFMGNGFVHMTERYSNLDTTNPKAAKITTESRPVLQPCDVDAYFSYVVCDE